MRFFGRRDREPQPSDGVTHDAVGGMLRSELDAGSDLPHLFLVVGERTSRIADAVRAGQLDRQTAAEALSALRIVDQAGAVWACNSSDLVWHVRHGDGGWEPASPPLDLGQDTFRLADPVGPPPPAPAAPAPAPAEPAPAPPTPEAHELEALLQRDTSPTLEDLPPLADDVDRPADDVHGPVDVPRLVEPGATTRSTDDALGDRGRLTDDDLRRLLDDEPDDGLTEPQTSTSTPPRSAAGEAAPDGSDPAGLALAAEWGLFDSPDEGPTTDRHAADWDLHDDEGGADEGGDDTSDGNPTTPTAPADPAPFVSGYGGLDLLDEDLAEDVPDDDVDAAPPPAAPPASSAGAATPYDELLTDLAQDLDDAPTTDIAVPEPVAEVPADDPAPDSWTTLEDPEDEFDSTTGSETASGAADLDAPAPDADDADTPGDAPAPDALPGYRDDGDAKTLGWDDLYDLWT